MKTHRCNGLGGYVMAALFLRGIGTISGGVSGKQIFGCILIYYESLDYLASFITM